MDAKVVNALERLLLWAEKANQRIAFEQHQGEQFGGNSYLNPVFKEARAVLEEVRPRVLGFNRVEVVRGNDFWKIRKGASLRLTALPTRVGTSFLLTFSLVWNNRERVVTGYARNLSGEEFNLSDGHGCSIRLRKIG